jgi:hypothetical protein
MSPALKERPCDAQQIVNGEAMKGVPGSNKMIIVADANWQTLFGLPF